MIRALEDFLERYLLRAALAIFVFGVGSACVAILVPLGLSPEGDAVDYRIPLLRWILRHATFPNWAWTYIDDYPALGEILMLPFYALSPGFARLVPIVAYAGVCWVGAKLLVLLADEYAGNLTEAQRRILFWTSAAGLTGLRPLLIQANLLMVDNLCSFFVLLSLYWILSGRYYIAAFAIACAIATRYTAWGIGAPAVFAALFWRTRKTLPWRTWILFLAIASIGAWPTLIRNFLVNGGNPFFPLFPQLFGQVMKVDFVHRAYFGPIGLLRLPYDMLWNHHMRQDLYDYTLGKLFFAQLFVVLGLALAQYRQILTSIRRAWGSELSSTALIFTACYTTAWYFSFREMRFFVPVLVLGNIFFFYVIVRLARPIFIWGIVFLTLFSIISVQKESWLIAAGMRTLVFAEQIQHYANCRKNLPVGEVIGHAKRATVLGYFDDEFRYVRPHPYAIHDRQGNPFPIPNYVYGTFTHPDYEPWPLEEPCMQRRKSIP